MALKCNRSMVYIGKKYEKIIFSSAVLKTCCMAHCHIKTNQLILNIYLLFIYLCMSTRIFVARKFLVFG
jgi:hypothetical protein